MMEPFVALIVLIVFAGLVVVMTRGRYGGEGNKAEQIKAMMKEVDRYRNKRRHRRSHNSSLDVASETE